jgi:hypothetical protein
MELKFLKYYGCDMSRYILCSAHKVVDVTWKTHPSSAHRSEENGPMGPETECALKVCRNVLLGGASL